MRKFTKEIAALIAAAAVSSSVSTAAATSEDVVISDGLTLAPTEEYPPVDGGMMLPDDYIEQPTQIVGDMLPPDGYIEPTTTEEIPPLAGEPMPPDEYIEPTTIEGIPPTAGVPMPPDEYIEPTTTEEIPPLAGEPMPPDDYIEPTTMEGIPPTAGVPMPPDAYIEPTILGDANCDDAVSMADAAAIYQYLGNSDKYALSEQGEANSDVDGNAGLTAADAIAIQKFNAKLIEELPGNNSENGNKFATLEFQITENVENVDFSQYNRNYGMMGGKEYYGTGYSAVKDEDGNEVAPEHYVLYTITAYPDYADGGQYVTRIEITDPNVMVHGLTVKSTIEEYEAVFSEMGYTTEIKDVGEYRYFTAKNDDGISYIFNEVNGSGNPMLAINAEVTNRDGIVY